MSLRLRLGNLLPLYRQTVNEPRSSTWIGSDRKLRLYAVRHTQKILSSPQKEY